MDADVSQSPIIAVHCALLHLSYYATTSALYRARNRTPLSKAKVSEAASNIACICAYLNQRGLVRYLPVNAIPTLVPSIISNALLIRSISGRFSHSLWTSAQEHEMGKARDSLNELLISLSTLRQAYVGADWVLLFVEAFLDRVGLKMVEQHPTVGRTTTCTQRRFEAVGEPHPAPSLPPKERVPVSHESRPSAARIQAVGRDAAVQADIELTNANSTPSSRTDFLDEWLNPSVCDGAIFDDSAWFDMANTLPFGSNAPLQDGSLGFDWTWEGTNQNDFVLA